MPLVKTAHIGNEVIWGLWQITETLPELLHLLAAYPIDYQLQAGKNIARLRESIAARLLAQTLAAMKGLQGGAIQKDEFDAPFWAHEAARLSISHTTGFAAAIIHLHASCGIDIEWPHERIWKIAPRVFSSEELAQAANLQQLTTIWCAKEALYKWHRVGSIEFRTQLQVKLNGNRISGMVQSNQRMASPILCKDNFDELVVVYCWL